MITINKITYTDNEMTVILDFWGTKVILKFQIPEIVISKIINENKHLI